MKQWKKSGFLKGIFLVTLFLSVFVDTVAGMAMIACGKYASPGKEKPKDFFAAGEEANVLLDGNIRLFEEYMQIGSLITEDGEIDYDKKILVSILDEKSYTIRELLKNSTSEGEAAENFRDFMEDFLKHSEEGKSYPWYTRRALHTDIRVILEDGNIFQFQSPNVVSLTNRKIENMAKYQKNMVALTTDTQKYKENLGESIVLQLPALDGEKFVFYARSAYEGYLIKYFPEYAGWYFLDQAVSSYEKKDNAGRDDFYSIYGKLQDKKNPNHLSEKAFYEMIKKSKEERFNTLPEEKIPWSVHLLPRTMEEARKYVTFLVETYQELQYYFTHSNFFYVYENSQGFFLTNRKNLWQDVKKEAEQGESLKKAVDADPFLYAFFDKKQDEGRTNFTRESFGMSGNVIEKLKYIGDNYKSVSYQIAVGLDLRGIRSARYEDTFQQQYALSNQRFQMFGQGKSALAFSACLTLFCFLMLAIMGGYVREIDGYGLNWYDRIFLEVQLVIGFVFLEMIWWMLKLWNKAAEAGFILLFGAAISVLAFFVLGILLSMVKRQKLHLGIRYSLVLFFLSEVVWHRMKVRDWIAQAKRRAAFLPVRQKYALLLFAEVSVFLYGAGCLVFVKLDAGITLSMFLASPAGIICAALAGMFLVAIFLWQRQAFLREEAEWLMIEGTKRILEGDFAYQIPDVDGAGVRGAELVRIINQIGGALEQAVEESVRNERLKTELIANVSHDIKTPLTSVINYVDLMKREQVGNETVRKYLDVLERKSLRLKTLIEDLVEASKASSGVMELEIQRLDFNELIRQTNGEFDDRFEECNLELISDLPDEVFYFEGDGRRVFRILENLYNNTAKYAMEHTRVYVSLKKEQESLVFAMKNISASKLNITPEELTERFVRGDRSRTTEGSGLGLSIAKSLTELMGGTFVIELDGDLFCVKVCFPVIDED